ncbi:MAG: hypothetical protein NXI01_00050 [Gammaproteobacteria bacterium]|nr:hypothetical protein [Gammaproteobacteria bacterium]
MKKFMTMSAFFLSAACISVHTPSFAERTATQQVTDGTGDVVNGTVKGSRNVIRGTGDAAQGAAQGVGDATKDGVDAIGQGTQDLIDDVK